MRSYNSHIISIDPVPHSHWWAIQVDHEANTQFFWAELCKVPVNTESLFRLRVVFPFVNGTSFRRCQIDPKFSLKFLRTL